MKLKNGAHLKQIRKKFGLSQEGLTFEINKRLSGGWKNSISYRTIARLENGQKSWKKSGELIKIIEEVLG